MVRDVLDLKQQLFDLERWRSDRAPSRVHRAAELPDPPPARARCRAAAAGRRKARRPACCSLSFTSSHSAARCRLFSTASSTTELFSDAIDPQAVGDVVENRIWETDSTSETPCRRAAAHRSHPCRRCSRHPAGSRLRRACCARFRSCGSGCAGRWICRSPRPDERRDLVGRDIELMS